MPAFASSSAISAAVSQDTPWSLADQKPWVPANQRQQAAFACFHAAGYP